MFKKGDRVRLVRVPTWQKRSGVKESSLNTGDEGLINNVVSTWDHTKGANAVKGSNQLYNISWEKCSDRDNVGRDISVEFSDVEKI